MQDRLGTPYARLTRAVNPGQPAGDNLSAVSWSITQSEALTIPSNFRKASLGHSTFTKIASSTTSTA
jgi:hypothetical protein